MCCSPRISPGTGESVKLLLPEPHCPCTLGFLPSKQSSHFWSNPSHSSAGHCPWQSVLRLYSANSIALFSVCPSLVFLPVSCLPESVLHAAWDFPEAVRLHLLSCWFCSRHCNFILLVLRGSLLSLAPSLYTSQSLF